MHIFKSLVLPNINGIIQLKGPRHELWDQKVLWWWWVGVYFLYFDASCRLRLSKTRAQWQRKHSLVTMLPLNQEQTQWKLQSQFSQQQAKRTTKEYIHEKQPVIQLHHQKHIFRNMLALINVHLLKRKKVHVIHKTAKQKSKMNQNQIIPATSCYNQSPRWQIWVQMHPPTNTNDSNEFSLHCTIQQINVFKVLSPRFKKQPNEKKKTLIHMHHSHALR